MLTDWLQIDSCFEHIYPIAENAKHRHRLIQSCREEQYDLVFFMASHRSERFAKFARQIAPTGFVAGLSVGKHAQGIFAWHAFRRLDAYTQIEFAVLNSQAHITQRYQRRYASLFGEGFVESITQQSLPIHVPQKYQTTAAQWLLERAHKNATDNVNTLLLNPISTSDRRNYTWAKVKRLMQLLQQSGHYHFVLNLPPDRLQEFVGKVTSDDVLRDYCISCFSATEHFCQLPAMLQQADCVVTVETATMHLAASLSVPQVVLMRDCAKHWQPLIADTILFAKHKVDEIAPEQVAESVNTILAKYAYKC